MHLYEWNPRVLYNEKDVAEAVSGRRLSFPGTDSRWTDRLSPGISDFATLPDDELVEGLGVYLAPLMDFAINVLKSKEADFGSFPIYLRATAGMRTLTTKDRARVMGGIRFLFSNVTFSPFYFEDEQARTISGEEEAIFGWAGVNFLQGNLIEDSQGAGTVINPRLTYGALDLGGASTQISFYQPTNDIMSNLFKLQIGQGKHWNVYAHSFLYYGINEATNRLEARLINGKDANERLVTGVYNPCLPGGASKEVRNNIHFDSNNVETFKFNSSGVLGNGYEHAILKNHNVTGDYDACSQYAFELLHKDKNNWCEFAHQGECSFAGVYQPDLPKQNKHFGEFLAFSNFYHAWDFLGLPSRSSLTELDAAARTACSMSKQQLQDFAGHRVDADTLDEMCFRSTYAFQLLRNGYGFQMDDYITATGVVAGQKVGWALGAMMYEINTLPWHYDKNSRAATKEHKSYHDNELGTTIFFSALVFGMFVAMASIFRSRRAEKRFHYESIKTVDNV
jgi:Golgi nucleoside diphosphatase